MDSSMIVQKTITRLLMEAEGHEREVLQGYLLQKLAPEDKQEVLDVFAGRRDRSLSSDIIAKKIFDPNEHPERLQKILREITKDSNLTLEGTFRNEGYIQSETSKKVIFDIPARLLDGRISDTEVQVTPQEFIFQRADIYSAELLMMQYSVEQGQNKSELDYRKVRGTLVIVLMNESPELFEGYRTDRYIHRFVKMHADSGLSYDPLSQTIYVQLDKCLAQFREGRDGEDNRELQLLLSMMADINDEKVKAEIKNNLILEDIYKEVSRLAQNKEVQMRWIAEKYAAADWNAAKEYERRRVIKEMSVELFKKGVPLNIIAEAGKVPVSKVEEWLEWADLLQKSTK